MYKYWFYIKYEKVLKFMIYIFYVHFMYINVTFIHKIYES